MSRKPYNLGDGAPAKGGAGGAYNSAETQETARDEGKTIFEAGTEAMTADGEVGDVEEPEKAGERPVYGPALPFPPATATTRKPYKI